LIELSYKSKLHYYSKKRNLLKPFPKYQKLKKEKEG